jgi:hypothetical protein
MLVTHFQKLFFFAAIFALSTSASLRAQTFSGNAGPYTCPAPTALTPVWGKLVINGNTVACYYAVGAATPTAWLPIGQPVTINFLNNPLLVGIYITAHNAAVLSSGTIDNVSISPTPTYQLQDQDIGAPKLMGCANLISGVWSIAGSGADIWGSTDQCNFQPWLVTGNCTVICRVTSLSNGSSWQKIGVMVRDGYNSGSDYALFCATNGEGVDFQYRTSFNNNGDVVKYVAPPAPGITSGVAIGTGLIGTVEGPYPLHP